MNRAQFLASSASTLMSAAVSAPGGRTFFQPFASAPFPHASRAGGHSYQGKLYDAAAHYIDATVAIYIPRNYRTSATSDFIVHFHGWNNDVRHVLERYRLREQVDESR